MKVEQIPASKVKIAERRKPNHLACPVICEWIRCIKGTKTASRGFYHINAVDTVTHWQVVGCLESIFRAAPVPVLDAMLHQFPFSIRGFH